MTRFAESQVVVAVYQIMVDETGGQWTIARLDASFLIDAAG
jgi:hypothetical protein